MVNHKPHPDFEYPSIDEKTFFEWLNAAMEAQQEALKNADTESEFTDAIVRESVFVDLLEAWGDGELSDVSSELREHTCHHCSRSFVVDFTDNVVLHSKTRYCPRCGYRL